MMGSFLRKYLIIVLVAIFYAPANGHAFSFGGIELNSSFGEKFDAVIELHAKGTGLLNVTLGRQEDYKLLQIPRASIVDELTILPIQDLENRKIIRLVSDKPLFFPSFHLILRATHDGDTIFKKYLITVDFQQNLALNLKGKNHPRKDKSSEGLDKKQKDLSQISAEQLATIQGKENILEEDVFPEEARKQAVNDEFMVVSAPSDFAIDPAKPTVERKQVTPSSGATWVSLRKISSLPDDFSGVEEKVEVAEVIEKVQVIPEVAEAKEPETPKVENNVESGSAPASPVPAEPAQRLVSPAQVIPPVSLVVVGENLYSDRRLQALANFKEQNAIRLPTKLVVVDVDKGDGLSARKSSASGLISGKSQAIHKGQTLLSVAREVSLSGHGPARIAVALWLENPEKFINGNINGVMVGTQFNLDGLMNRLDSLDSQTASAILRNQWREWKVLRENKPFIEEESSPVIEEYPPPSQQVQDKEKLFLALEDWKNTWEKGDFDGHIQHYFQQAGHGEDHQNLISQKKKMFQRYQDVRLDVGRSSLVVNGGKVWVTFIQHFSSQSLDSLGRKDLQVVLEGKEWKIKNERFKLKSFLEKDYLAVTNVAIKPKSVDEENIASPYVIHVNSYLTQKEARKTVGKLRKAGYDAYSAAIRVSKSKRIYRVYVGRYSSWGMVRDLAMEIRNHKFGENAIPSPHRWVIQVGNFLSSDDAEEKLDSMRIQGLSPFLFTVSEADFSFPTFRVYLGAFIKKNHARQMIESLELLEIPHTLVTP